MDFPVRCIKKVMENRLEGTPMACVMQDIKKCVDPPFMTGVYGGVQFIMRNAKKCQLVQEIVESLMTNLS